MISYVDQSSSTIDSEVSCNGMIRPRARFNHAHLPLDLSGTITITRELLSPGSLEVINLVAMGF